MLLPSFSLKDAPKQETDGQDKKWDKYDQTESQLMIPIRLDFSGHRFTEHKESKENARYGKKQGRFSHVISPFTARYS